MTGQNTSSAVMAQRTEARAALGARAAERETEFRWIPPGTRKRLERPGDYDQRGTDGP